MEILRWAAWGLAAAIGGLVGVYNLTIAVGWVMTRKESPSVIPVFAGIGTLGAILALPGKPPAVPLYVTVGVCSIQLAYLVARVLFVLLTGRSGG